MAQKQKIPDKVKIQKTEGSIEKIKSALVTLASKLKGTRQKLGATKNRLKTSAQKKKYTVLLKLQAALEKSTKAQSDKYKVLVNTMGKFKSIVTAITKGAKAAAGKVVQTAKKSVSWLKSKIQKKKPGLRELGDIESLDDLGVAPLVIWGIVVATIAALSAAIGSLLSKTSKLEEQIDALNDEIDRSESEPEPEPEPEEPEPEPEEPEPEEEEEEEES